MILYAPVRTRYTSRICWLLLLRCILYTFAYGRLSPPSLRISLYNACIDLKRPQAESPFRPLGDERLLRGSGTCLGHTLAGARSPHSRAVFITHEARGPSWYIDYMLSTQAGSARTNVYWGEPKPRTLCAVLYSDSDGRVEGFVSSWNGMRSKLSPIATRSATVGS